MSPDPIVAETTVPVAPTEAFVGFTAQMGEWWDPLLTEDAASFTSVEIDPDGDVAMAHGTERHVWGRVTTWSPPERYAQECWLGHDPDSPTTTLEVTFDGDETSTRVRLVHSGFADVRTRDEYRHWDDLLARFAAHVSD